MRRAVRFLGIILVLVFVISALPLLPLNVFASGSYLINGKTVTASDSVSTEGQCWAYANAIYKKIWGVNFTSQFGTSDNFLRDLAKEELTLTPEHLKEYVSAAELGSSLRICNEPNLYANDSTINGKPGHNQIIVQKDDAGFTVIQGGLTASPHYAENYYTWEGFVNTSWLGGTYHYIKYIKWPEAPSYATVRALSQDGPFITGAIYPSGTLLLGKSCSLGGIISSPRAMTGVSGQVIDLGGNVVLSYSKNINATRYNIATEGMDAALTFGKLIPGGFRYVVKATDALGSYTVFESFFTVAPSKVANELKIYEFLINKGFNKAAVCAALANIERESYFNPGSTYLEAGGYNSYGICQWNLSRYEALKSYCAQYGYAVNSLEGQLLFMLNELQYGKYAIYQTVYDTLVNAPDSEQGAYDGAYSWCVNYEIPANKEAQGVDRGNLAKEYFLRYSEAGNVKISFNSRGAANYADVTAKYGYNYGTLPEPRRVGCTFDGWYTQPVGGNRVTSSSIVWVTGSQTLYAHWTPLSYQIKYVIDENNVQGTSYTYGDTVVLPDDLTKTGYTFEGWYTSSDFSGEPVYTISALDYGAKTFYAKWRVFTGISVENGKVFYIENGDYAAGFKTVGGNKLYFWSAKGGEMMTQTFASKGVTYQMEPFTYKGLTLYRVKEVKNGLRAEEDGVRYYVDDQFVTGLRTVDGELMAFDENGWMMKDNATFGLKSYSFARFEKDDMTLYRAVKEGLHEENGSVRFYRGGVYETGWQTFGEYKVYFLTSTGLMLKQTAVISGVTHEFVPFEYEGHTLYRTTYVKNGFFAEDGGVRYYENGVYVYGWKTVDGNRMFFDIYTGKMVDYDFTIGGTFYHFEPFAYNGMTLYRAAKNGLYAENGGVRLYVYGDMQTGWQTVGGYEVYFDPSNGIMLTKTAVIDGKTCRFEPVSYGEFTLYKKADARYGFYSENGGVRYYVNDEYVTGWQTVDGNEMYFRVSNGLMLTETAVIGGKTYRFEAFDYNGMTLYRRIMPKNGLYRADGGVKYYVDDVLQTGWQTFDGKNVYFRISTGLMFTQTVMIDQVTYKAEPFEYEGFTLYSLVPPKNGFYAENGAVRYYVRDVMQKGLQTIDGDVFFFDPETGEMASQTRVIGGKLCCFEAFDKDGMTLYRMTDVKNGVYFDDDGVRFYENGVSLTGWQTVGGWQVYFLPASGLMCKSDRLIDGVYCRFTVFDCGGIALYGLTGEGGNDAFSELDYNGDGTLSIEDVASLLDLLSNGAQGATIENAARILDLLAGKNAQAS